MGWFNHIGTCWIWHLLSARSNFWGPLVNGGNPKPPPRNGLIRNEIPWKCHHHQGIKRKNTHLLHGIMKIIFTFPAMEKAWDSWNNIRSVLMISSYCQFGLVWCYPPETNMEREKMMGFPKGISSSRNSFFRFHVSFRECRFSLDLFHRPHFFSFSIGPSTFQPPFCPKVPQHGVLQEHDAICHGWTNDICNGRQRLALVFLNETWESSCWVFRNDSEVFTVHPNS